MTTKEEIKSISDLLDKVAKNTTDEFLNDYSEDLENSNDEISGLETEMTGSLRTKINDSLLENIKKELDSKIIGRYKFKVQTFKGKSQEPFTGADILGKLEIEINGSKLFKYFIVQSKIAKSNNKGLSFGDNNMLNQANKMLNHTPDSFFFLYNKKGIEVISSFMVKLLNRRTLNTSQVGYKSFGQFYTDHFNCFIGDNRHWFIRVNPQISPSDFVQYVIDIKISKNE